MCGMRIVVVVWFLFSIAPYAFGAPVTIPEYADVPNIERYASREEYEAARGDANFTLTRVSYPSGGLTVFAYLYAPAKKPDAPLPVIVLNRGSGGAKGRDELGGADVDDLMNTATLIRGLPYADPAKVFLYGESRGAMMTYQALRDRYPARAAAVYGGFTSVAELTKPGGKFEKAAAMIWPDYAEKKAEIDRRRSALDWADRIAVPLLIMHGGADDDVSPSHPLALAAKLQELGKTYELIIRAGDNHVLTQWRHERDAHAIEWFRKH